MRAEGLLARANVNHMRRVQAAFLFTLLVCFAITGRQAQKPNLADFQVYDAAAELVHERQSPHMYDGADNEAVFKLKFADVASPFGQAARHLGVDQVRLYIYPPILADLLLPFAFVSAATAGKLWLLVNFAAILLTSWIMARELGVRAVSPGGLLILLGLLALFGTGMCLIWGQVTLVLLLLWTAGIHLYRRGWLAASASVLALATAIKLTPLLIVVPFVLWREWRWLRVYAAVLVGCFAAMLLVNSPATLTDYAMHVMPSMSGGGVPDFENKSLLSSVQLLYLTLHGAAVHPVTMPVPKGAITAGKAVSLALVLVAMGVVARVGAAMRGEDRRMTLALFALLSAAIAPISWKHAYVVAFLPLAFFWVDAFRRSVATWELALLTLCSIELGSFVFDSVIVKATHGMLFGVLSFVAPGAAILLVLAGLLPMRRASAAQPAR